ncbi:hypothetical protein CCACVL1_24791 [Corchorus capsularis]|uniref:Uncharacterized protein n=1 Tax=Corchorus capsularis TaxID=210143 RepID=A0A1R3GMZ8_COCAP|nr:hypothetical protein CCACVL1_24791 [Corchorus capsularis]
MEWANARAKDSYQIHTNKVKSTNPTAGK